MDPAEFLQHFTRTSKPAQNLAIERQLVDAAWISVRDIQILRGSGSNAHRPGRARLHREVIACGAGGAPDFRGAIANRYRRIGWWCWYLQMYDLQQLALRI